MSEPDYKLLWERDSTALGKVLNELSMARACNQDLKAANATLRNDLTAARLDKEALLKLASEWENAIQVAYSDYAYGQRCAYEHACRELRAIIEPADQPTGES